MIHQFFKDVLRLINATLFNTLLRRKDLCTCANGFQIKIELSHIEEWISKTLKMPELRNLLDNISESTNVLVMSKSMFGEKDNRTQVCPNINAVQLKRLIEYFTPDSLAPDPVPRDVMAKFGDVRPSDKESLELDTSISVSNLNFDMNYAMSPKQ